MHVSSRTIVEPSRPTRLVNIDERKLPMIHRISALGFGTALAIPLVVPAIAYAGIDACGDIHVEANARCEVVVEGGCTAMCEPVRFEAACAAKLEAQCAGQCTVMATAECTGQCEADCQGQCEVNPGEFDCSASCQGQCEANCDAQCSASANQGECKASCVATCSGSCSADCEGTKPEATCEAKCEASCSGSCEAEANIDCQVRCQGNLYADCKADLEGGCTAQCQEPDGALFCDGQYVDAGNNLEECVNALKVLLDIEVEGWAHGSCSGNVCSGEAGGSITCAVAQHPHTWAGLGWLVLGLGLSPLAFRRRMA